jgi:hypothetical protein
MAPPPRGIRDMATHPCEGPDEGGKGVKGLLGAYFSETVRMTAWTYSSSGPFLNSTPARSFFDSALQSMDDPLHRLLFRNSS